MDVFIQKVAREGGALALRAFREGVLVRQYKNGNPNNIVTETDIEVENHIIAQIHAWYPSHGIIAEESGKEAFDAEDVWIIDPIDGTLNFATGIPLFAIMIAHMHTGTIDASAIYLPVTDELFFATEEGPSFCNGHQVSCSSKNTLERSRGCISSPASSRSLDLVASLNRQVPRSPVHINSYGSMGIHACYVAAGRRDWMVSFAPSFHDLAATALLLEKSGCTVTDARGDAIHAESRGLIAAHPDCHISLLQIVQEVLRERGEL